MGGVHTAQGVWRELRLECGDSIHVTQASGREFYSGTVLTKKTNVYTKQYVTECAWTWNCGDVWF